MTLRNTSEIQAGNFIQGWEMVEISTLSFNLHKTDDNLNFKVHTQNFPT